MQSTGQTLTQPVSTQSMHRRVIVQGIEPSPRFYKPQGPDLVRTFISVSTGYGKPYGDLRNPAIIGRHHWHKDLRSVSEAVSFNGQTVQFEKRELVPIATLKDYESVAHGEEPATAQTLRIAPFQRHDLACFMYRLHDARHVCGSELMLEHRPDRLHAPHRLLHHLVIDGIGMIEAGQPVRIGGVEPFDPAFKDF